MMNLRHVTAAFLISAGAMSTAGAGAQTPIEYKTLGQTSPHIFKTWKHRILPNGNLQMMLDASIHPLRYLLKSKAAILLTPGKQNARSCPFIPNSVKFTFKKVSGKHYRVTIDTSPKLSAAIKRTGCTISRMPSSSELN